jgi:capsular exopolysaccharide synthesis family protein
MLCFVGALVLLLPAAYVVSRAPARFVTSATVLLETRPDRVPLFPEFSPFRPLPVQLAILRSRSLAEAVIENLPKASLEDLIERPYYVDYQLELKNLYRRLTGTEPEVESPLRRALKELPRARMKFDATRDGIVTVSAEATKPQVAVDLVSAYVEVLISRTRSFNVDDARASREFLEQLLNDAKKNLRGSEDSLRAFTAAHGGVKLPDKSQATVTQLGQAESSLAEVEANRKMIEARLLAAREKLAEKGSAPPPPPTTARTMPADIQRLRAQLGQLETALLELRAKYTEAHPRIVLVKDRIAEVQRELGDYIKETTPLNLAPGAVPPGERINFADQVLALETALHTTGAQEEALGKQVETLRRSLSGLSRSELEYTRLAREAETSRNLSALLVDKLAAARIREQGEMKVVKVIDPPGTPLQSVDDSLKFLMAALVLALGFAGGVPGAVEWIYRRVETEDDVEAVTGLPVLAAVPRVRSRRPIFGALGDGADRRRPSDGVMFTEALRSLRVAIQLAVRTEGLRTILITSAFESEGKSTLVFNLGLAFREVGKRVGLADTDFHRPTLHGATKVASDRGGLVEALQSKRGNIAQSLAPIGEGMWLAPRGAAFKPQSRGMMATGRLKELIDELTEHADIVLCDSSPVLLIPESLFLASAVDGVIIVAKAGSTPARDLARTKATLESVGARILGVVINEIPISTLSGYYRRHYYAYGRKDGK